MSSQVVGVLGGGQLGRMLIEAASRLNITVLALDPAENSPAKQISSAPHHHGSFSDPSKIRSLAEQVDVLTVEIEHVDAGALQKIRDENSSKGGRSGKGIKVHPSPETILIIQDKYNQKVHLSEQGLPVADFVPISEKAGETELSITEAIERFGLPLMLKSRTQAYDGRGNYLLKTKEDMPNAINALGNGSRPLYAERFERFEAEIAVMVVKSGNGELKSYDPVETVHRDNICHLVKAPLRRGKRGTAEKARKFAEEAIGAFGAGAIGIFGVEMFLLPDGTLLINEIAPRPHNSGHHTIEACHASQFENHLRSILSLPLGSTALKVPATAMLNLLGASDSTAEIDNVVSKSLAIPGATTHLYGKEGCRPGRKMGHITVVADSDAELEERLRPLLEALPQFSSYYPDPLPPVQQQPGGFSHPNPLVSIIMGSTSDLPVMLAASKILSLPVFSIPHELTIVSAHRTPDRMVEHAKDAAERGVRVIIAGAGGAAHLPGMVAALTCLPVVGVPVKGSTLDGVDSLHSIVQMPRGIPVATVAINNSTNAALLAVRIIAASNPQLQKAVLSYQDSAKEEVLEKIEKLEEVGWLSYKE